MNKIIKKLIATALVLSLLTGCSASNESSNTNSGDIGKESSASNESSTSSSTESESSSSESSSESSSSESISESSSSGESSTSEPEEKKDGITLCGKLYLIRTTQVFCYDTIENMSNSFDDINYTVFDKDGNEVFKGNLIKNMNEEFSMYDGLAFDMQVPEWKEGSTYKVAFENLPVEYSEILTAARTNRETFEVETTMNENGKYNATVDIEYFFYESSYTDPATGKTSIVKQEFGVNNTISFRHAYKEKGQKHCYYSVLDENDKLIPNAEIIMITEKGEYKTNTGLAGVGQMTGYSSGETIKQWDIYYNNKLLRTVENTIGRRTSSDINLLGLKLIGVDVTKL